MLFLLKMAKKISIVLFGSLKFTLPDNVLL